MNPKILNSRGKFREIVIARTYLPRSTMPKYTLSPPTGSNMIGNPTLVTMPTLRDLVIRAAENPTGESHAAFCNGLRTATVFVKLIGVTDPIVHGKRFTVPEGAQVRTRSARLPQGMQMLRVAAAPPCEVAPDEVICTMTGGEALRMAMRMDGHGLLVTAEDDRNSWTAITRDGIPSLLNAP